MSMPEDLETKRRYAEKYGGFFGAVIYIMKSKLGLTSKSKQGEK